MNEKNKNEEIQSRREFFKKAAKATLPILGAVVLSSLPLQQVEALANYSNSLPTYDQWGELYGMCDWVWLGTAYKVVGPNGNFIKLPASGARDIHGKVNSVGLAGSYWSSKRENSQEAHCLGFGSETILMFTSFYNIGYSVRLVQNE